MYIGKYGNGLPPPPQSYYSFINNPTAYATCVDKKDGLWSGVFAWGCQVQEDWKNAGSKPLPPNSQMGIGGIDKQFQKDYPQKTPPSQQKGGGVAGLISSGSAGAGAGASTSSGGGGGGGGTPASNKCGGCDAGNIGCELGKLSCEAGAAAADWWNGMGESIGKGTGGLGILPIIAIGGGILIVALLARR